MEYRKRYQKWMESSVIDEETKKELSMIADNEKEIEDRFYRELEFGTGGLRGVIGAGSNRVNKYTIGKATQGLANYIKKEGQEAMKRGVVIAYDSRKMSRELAEHSALVLNANGIKSYLFEELEPTPILSFSVRELQATAGIVITASHNPPQYNGYKVYWDDGGQIPPDRADSIIREINEIEDFEQIQLISKEQAKQAGLFVLIGEDILQRYINRVKALSINSQLVREMGKDLKIIYTPLHGTGNKPVRRVLKELGFQNVTVVSEQELPDPNFSTVVSPNPEEAEAFKLAIQLAEKEGADIIIGTDPDCDRVGVVVKNKQGQYVVLTGNQTGALLVHYILSAKKEAGTLHSKGRIIKTIVTSEMGREIAKSYGIETIDTLTGFKFIGEKIKEFEEDGDKEFIFGYEESYGYLAGDFVRDKDAIIASMLICEMAAYYKHKGMTLYDGLMELWEKYGYYIESLKSITMTGKEGMEKIQLMMNSFREDPPARLAGMDVNIIQDYLKQKAYKVHTGLEEPLTLPKSNVLKFITEDGSWFCIRPSGTEPKVKLYFSVSDKTMEKSKNKMEKLMKDVMERIGQ